MPAAAAAAIPIDAEAAQMSAGDESAHGPSAIETLHAAAGDGKDAPTKAIALYDGGKNHRGSSGAGGNGDGSNQNDGKTKPMPAPAKAPVGVFSKVFFPGTGTIKVNAKQAETFKIMESAMRNGGYLIATTPGKDTAEGHRALGTLMRVNIKTDDGEGKPIAEMTPIRAVKITGYEAKDGITFAKVSYPSFKASDPARLGDLAALFREHMEQYAHLLEPDVAKVFVGKILPEQNLERMAYVIAMEMPFSPEVKLRLLGAPSAEARLEEEILELSVYFHAKTVKAQAVADGKPASPFDSVEAMKSQLQAIGMPAAVQETALKEYAKYTQLNAKEGEAQKLRTYIEWLLEVPWGQRTEDNLDIAKAREILNQGQWGLEKAKDRILEFLALRKKTGSKKGAIISFTGPPGVGKTALAKAIAKAMGRKFVRLSMGGLHDESDVRGHGRTYQGSMPGEIIRQMKYAGTVNPVMLMDEIDKIGHQSAQGDPSAALLEVLDPEQNNTFRDRYLDVPYDLSEVLFVITSNELAAIPEPLRDRMELIELDGYTTHEKVEISEQFIIPQEMALAGLKPGDVTLTKDAIKYIIEHYTMGAGMRQPRQELGAVLRKFATWTDMHDGEVLPSVVEAKDVEKFLGSPRFVPRQTAQNGVGVATGLAVNGHGGSTLNVEVSHEPGTGLLRLRKQFGNDIDDSAHNAYAYVKKNAAKFGLQDFDFKKVDLDIDITPSGKVDGPSAGGLFVTAIISALTGRAVTQGLAMTGEITKRGDILPIGGLKQKVLAAHRMGYTEVIFPFANLKDLEGIPQEVRDGIKLKAVKTYDEIYPDAIVPAETETAK
ncbi:MAG: endopeptidase La [Elusimicrobiota bacterium]